MDTRIRIKIGSFEVECEGTETFLREALTGLLSDILELHKESHIAATVEVEAPAKDVQDVGHPAPSVVGTTATIAAKLGCKTGPDLIMAAAARLTLVAGKSSLTRQEIHDEMKTAKGYYKKTFANNLTKHFKGLVDKAKLIESATDVYALPAAERQKLEHLLASS